jgi:lambda family phage portal protein
MFERLTAAWQTFKTWGAPSSNPVKAKASAADLNRMYSLGRPGRLTSGFGTQTTSEDTELISSLRVARNRSRELVRDAAYAKRAKVIIQNNIIGSGVGMQAKVKTTRDEFNETVNDEIEEVWEEWSYAEACHTGRSLHFCDLELQAVGQVFEAGEIFIRMWPMRIGASKVPLALELIEPERIADDVGPITASTTANVKLGIEVDRFGAPVNYLIRELHPGDPRVMGTATDRVERVPASDIIHLRSIDRWPQTRAMPWMHASGRKFQDMDGLTEAEITAARGAACYMGFIESPGGESEFGSKQEDGSLTTEIEPALLARLRAGEKFNFASPNRPNQHLDPFMRMMLREVAAGTGVSYESLSRDYSQSNYSSSRLALLDDRDLWRVLQMWFIRSVRQRVHKFWLQQAVLARAITSIPVEAYALNRSKYEAVRFKPRGWSWVDPTKEVEAAEKSIRNGFTTVSAVIASVGDGRDLEDVMKERRDELDYMKTQKLIFDNDPSTVKKEPAPGAAGDMTPTETQATTDNQAAADQTTQKNAAPIIHMHAGGRHG